MLGAIPFIREIPATPSAALKTLGTVPHLFNSDTPSLPVNRLPRSIEPTETYLSPRSLILPQGMIVTPLHSPGSTPL